MAACVPGRVRHSSWLARRPKSARPPARGQFAVRRRRQVQRILTVSINAAARSPISRCRPRFAARSRDLQPGRGLTRAADPLPAAIRICPLTVPVMAREVITERGPHPGLLRRESAAERVWIPTNFVVLLAAERADELFGIRLAIFEVLRSEPPQRDRRWAHGNRVGVGHIGHVVRRSGIEHPVPSPVPRRGRLPRSLGQNTKLP